MSRYSIETIKNAVIRPKEYKRLINGVLIRKNSKHTFTLLIEELSELEAVLFKKDLMLVNKGFVIISRELHFIDIELECIDIFADECEDNKYNTNRKVIIVEYKLNRFNRKIKENER